MRTFRQLLLIALCSCSLAAQTRPVYLDPSQPVEARVNDLASRMTLDEKISQMMYQAPAIERLGVPAYNWWNEALHGVARAGTATVFPQAIGLAATWDTALLHEVADVIDTEARAKYHDGLRRGAHDQYYGLTFWSPNINIFRDPRWGRGQETYGEDPFLTSRLGVAFVRGLQGDDPHYLKALATPKHFAVHSGPEPLRHGFNAPVSPRDLEETYLPAFRATLMEAKAGSVMCAYNAVTGQPACANETLLGKYLRGAWKFDGYVVSDCGAVDDMRSGHKFVGTPEQAAAAAVKAGTDLDCGDEYKALASAARQGLISEAEIDRAVKRLLAARFRLGMFDPPGRVPYAAIPYSENDSPQHRALALRAARESMVLLKNNGVLPFSKQVKRIAVIGPNADSMDVLVGNYNGTPSIATKLLAGMRVRFGDANVLYAPGAPLVPGFGLAVPSERLRPKKGSAQHGLKGEYFPNQELSGPPSLTRVDSNINFDFEASPVREVGPNHFSVRWSGVLVPTATGDYQLGAAANDGFRVFLDGRKIVDDWGRHGTETRLAPVHLEAGREYAVTMEYFQAEWSANAQLLWLPPNLREEALAAARQADVVVMALGISPRLEGEEMPVEVEGFAGGDRTSLDLPAPQQALMEAMAATGKPVVVVLLNGSALAVNWAQENAAAILEAWYPGEEGGSAIAETLAGDNNPAGRLPVTFYKSVADLPPFTDYSMLGRTYRYFKGEPLYRFGDGLSYSKFAYRRPQVRAVEGGVEVSVELENVSDRPGDEVVQVYLSAPPDSSAAMLLPLRKLVAFVRLRLKAHDKRAATLVVRDLTGVNEQGERVKLSGLLHFDAGGHQPGPGTVGVDFKVPPPK